MRVRCQTCGAEVEAKGRFHAGFNDTGFLYCDADSTVLIFHSYDRNFEEIVGDSVVPWELNDNQKRAVESNLIGCPCGGSFFFSNPLICPKCRGIFSKPMSEDIYFVELEGCLDGEQVSVWKQ